MSTPVIREGHYTVFDGKVFPICLPCKQDPSIPDVREWLAARCLCVDCAAYRLVTKPLLLEKLFEDDGSAESTYIVEMTS